MSLVHRDYGNAICKSANTEQYPEESVLIQSVDRHKAGWETSTSGTEMLKTIKDGEELVIWKSLLFPAQ